MSSYQQALTQFRRFRFCHRCQQAYHASAGHQKYCSARCRQAAYRANRAVHVRICPRCGKKSLATQLSSPGPRSVYCSNACRQAAYRARRKARPAAPPARVRRKVKTMWGFRELDADG